MTSAEIRSLSKIELHLHLDCSLSYDVVSVLDRSVTLEEYEHEFIAPARCSNLADFLSRAPRGFKLMQSKEALRRVTEDLFHQLESDGVVYAEIRFAPFLHVEQGLEPDEVVETIERSVDALVRTTNIQVGVILCTLRHFDEAQSLGTAKLVEQFRGSHVVALDLAGDEAGYPVRAHVQAYRYACERGLSRTAHAGEACGPESVWETLRLLDPQRIGHGRAALRTRCLLSICDTIASTWNSVPVLTCRSYRRSEA